jgi:hypothetical protein
MFQVFKKHEFCLTNFVLKSAMTISLHLLSNDLYVFVSCGNLPRLTYSA